MSKKRLLFLRDSHVLRIYDETDKPGDLTYTAIFNVTYLESQAPGWVDIHTKEGIVGFVSSVKEVKEKGGVVRKNDK